MSNYKNFDPFWLFLASMFISMGIGALLDAKKG